MIDEDRLDPRWRHAWTDAETPAPDAAWQRDLMQRVRTLAEPAAGDRDAIVARIFLRGALAAGLLAALTAFAVVGAGLDGTESAMRLIAVMPRSLLDLAILM